MNKTEERRPPTVLEKQLDSTREPSGHDWTLRSHESSHENPGMGCLCVGSHWRASPRPAGSPRCPPPLAPWCWGERPVVRGGARSCGTHPLPSSPDTRLGIESRVGPGVAWSLPKACTASLSLLPGKRHGLDHPIMREPETNSSKGIQQWT